jgi:hypothetical protein
MVLSRLLVMATLLAGSTALVVPPWHAARLLNAVRPVARAFGQGPAPR